MLADMTAAELGRDGQRRHGCHKQGQVFYSGKNSTAKDTITHGRTTFQHTQGRLKIQTLSDEQVAGEPGWVFFTSPPARLGPKRRKFATGKARTDADDGVMASHGITPQGP